MTTAKSHAEGTSSQEGSAAHRNIAVRRHARRVAESSQAVLQRPGDVIVPVTSSPQ
ncbi:hypothetical protein [Streptomyces monomycini]|uniref:hypothetical protein n=1 Tax=Streptomyces monomycini TaxID=371720 RepID=UPI000ABF389B|nr:hypothetical protein [Streptomyces monomycini]